MKNSKPLKSENVVPLDEAAQSCERWRDTASAKLVSDQVYSFKIPLVDFTQVLDENAVAVRAYLAEEADGTKKLYLVGIDEDGNDMIDYDKEQYIYDLTSPCPPMCPAPGPLNP